MSEKLSGALCYGIVKRRSICNGGDVMDICYIRAVVDDAGELIELQNQAFKDDYLKYGHCPSYDEPIDIMRKHISTWISYIITVDGENAGDIIIRKREGSSYYIRVLSIIPRFQNMHVGKKAIDFLEHTHTEGIAWELITPKDNARNCHFYESCGFVKTGEKKEDDKLTLNIYRKVI